MVDIEKGRIVLTAIKEKKTLREEVPLFSNRARNCLVFVASGATTS